MCIDANKMAQTALHNIATSIVNAPYPFTVLANSGTGSGTGVHMFRTDA